MPAYPGFGGGTYQSRSLTADCERAFNLYTERRKDGGGFNLAGTPGKLLMGTIGAGGDLGAALASADTSVPAVDDNTSPVWYAIVGNKLYYVTFHYVANVPTASATLIGTVTSRAFPSGDLIPAQIVVLDYKYLLALTDGAVFLAAFGTPISASALAAVAPIGFSTLNAGGAGYAVGDTGTINGGGVSAEYVVLTVSGGGAVLTYQLTNVGSGYVIAAAVATTNAGAQPGVGANFKINITSTAGGAGYAVGDTGVIDQDEKVQAFYTVNTVDGNGSILTYTLGPFGADYNVGATVGTLQYGTQPGIGTGFYVDISAVGAAAWAIARQTIAGIIPNDFYIFSATYQDNYAIVSISPNSVGPQRRQFFISGLNRFTRWNRLDFGTKEANPDPNTTVLSANQLLIVAGTQTTQLYYDSGDVNFPFVPVQSGGLIETGCASPWTMVKMDGTVIWLGTDARGQNVVWELRGLTPVRISNHAIETRWKNFQGQYATAFAYQEGGHFFYQLNFIIESQTWVYDSTTQEWHERGSSLTEGRTFIADLGRYSAYAQGIGRAVLDYRSGKIYMSDIGYWDEAGTRIYRERIPPALVDGDDWSFYTHARLLAEQGNPTASDRFLAVPLTYTLPTEKPTYTLEFSGNSGQTWQAAPIALATLAAGGAGYVVGDTGTINGGLTGFPAAYVIDAVAAGVVTAFHLTSFGKGYAAGGPFATTRTGAQPGVGAGFTVYLPSVGLSADGSATDPDAVVEWWRLGRFRQFVFRLRSASRVNHVWKDFFIEVDKGRGY